MTADSAVASSAASTASSSSSIPPPMPKTKRKVDPIAAVQDSIDLLALSLFEALRGVRDAVVTSSAVVDEANANATSTSAFLQESSSSEDHHHHQMMTTTMTASGNDVDDAMRAAKARLLNGLNLGYFSSRAYDVLEPDYEAFLLSYLADDPHARELVEMMSTTSSSSAVTADGKDTSVEAVRPSNAPTSSDKMAASISTSSSSSSSSPSDLRLAAANTTGHSKRVDIGKVGYEFRKEFSSGWFVGRVVEIRPLAANGRDRRCVYSDGDIEDLSLADLEQLARLDPNYNDSVGNVVAVNKRPRLTIKLNASRRPTATDDDDDDVDGNDAHGGGDGCVGDDRAVVKIPRTRDEYVALLRGAERLRDENTTRRLADDVLSRSRAVDELVAKLPGMGRTRDVQMDRIAILIRDNHRVMAELGAAHDLARMRREEVRRALEDNTCLALGVEDGDS